MHLGEVGCRPLNYSASLNRPAFFPQSNLTQYACFLEVSSWTNPSFDSILITIYSTVRCLAGLNGATLLNMTREEVKTVCPEEGGRVFFQLQAVRSTVSERPQ